MPNESSGTNGVTGVPIGDAAEHLGISVETLRKRLQRGRQEGYKDKDGTWRVLIAVSEPDPPPSLPAAATPAPPPKPPAPAPELLSHIAALTAEIQALRHETAAQRHKLDYLSAQVAQMDADNQDQLAALQALILSVEAEVSARDDDKASRLRKKLKPVLLMIVDLLQRRRQSATLAPYEAPPPVPPVLPAALSALPTTGTPEAEGGFPDTPTEPTEDPTATPTPDDTAASDLGSGSHAAPNGGTDWDLPFDGTEEAEADDPIVGAARDGMEGDTTEEEEEPDFDISKFLVDAPDPVRPEDAPLDPDATVDDHLDALLRADPVPDPGAAFETPVDGEGSTVDSHLDTLLGADTDDLVAGAEGAPDPSLDLEPVAPVTAESLGIDNLADLLAAEPDDPPDQEPEPAALAVEAPEPEDGLQVIEEEQPEELDISKFLVDAPDPTMPSLDELLSARDALDAEEHEDVESDLEVIEEEAPEDLDISKLLSEGPQTPTAKHEAMEPPSAAPTMVSEEEGDSFEPARPDFPSKTDEDLPADIPVDAPVVLDDVLDTDTAASEPDEALDLAAFLSGDPPDGLQSDGMTESTVDDLETPVPSEGDVSPAAAAAALLGIAPADPWALEPNGDDTDIPLLDEDDPFSPEAVPEQAAGDTAISPDFDVERGLETLPEDFDPDATLGQSRASGGLDTASLLSRLNREAPPIEMDEDEILSFEAPEDDGDLPEGAEIDDPWEPETPPTGRSER